LRPGEVADEGVELGRRKIEGLANKEYAAAAKDFAEAERKIIETELERRSLESKVRKEEAEARLAEINAVGAEIELLEKIKRIGVVLHRDHNGNITALRAPANCDWTRLVDWGIKADQNLSCPNTDCRSNDTILLESKVDSETAHVAHEQWRCNDCKGTFSGDRNTLDGSFTLH
jgi:hypothetical protein